MTQAHWLRLPAELRERPQWLLAGPNALGELKIPMTVGATGRPEPGSHSDSSGWLDFNYAVDCALEFGFGLGYVLAADDPFTCVDLDIKNQHNKPNEPALWTPPHHVEQMVYIVEQLDSYTELSQSQQGVHVWCRGGIGEGIKKSGVEVYSQLRFIACTGYTIHNPPKPIADRQDELSALVANMREAQEATRGAALYENELEADDNVIMERAWNADNCTKFRALWAGDWAAMGYPSQSEADLSLMSMLTFYSRNNEQCRRLFRASGLGQREKAIKNDRYLDYTLRLIRGRQAKEDAAVEAIAAQAAKLAGDARAMAAQEAARLQAQAAAQLAAGTPGPAPAPGAAPSTDSGLPWPPGVMGQLAGFVYNSAPRPVKEVAIVAALGWFAGVCGKCWNIPGSGLNLYIILVARSAVGKEAMHSGLSALTHRLREGVPSANHYVNFNDFASGPALAKACAEQSCFVNVSGEWGRKLQAIAGEGASGPMQSLRTVMTNLYQKSGPASIVGGINYSSKDNNVAAISGVSFSMIGETTPDTLYASLTDSMMEDGFLSRFNIVEYVGDRPPMNPNPVLVPSTDLTQRLQDVCFDSTNMLNNHTRVGVSRDPAAGVAMDAFDKECDAQINSTQDESWRQMWNRAHLKMSRVAALLAVADNHKAPVIYLHHVEWALELVRRDIALMRRRMESGDVGQGDDSRMKKLQHIMHEYLHQPLPPSYGVPSQMQRDGVVPRKYLQMRVSRVAAFNRYQYGAKRALDDAIQSCADSGYIAEMDKTKAGEAYTFQGRCFRIVQLPKFS